MKTIEEKAKAYDESVERAKVAYKDTDRHIKATIERIFPELAESEDERIRKAIVSFIETEACDSPISKEWIAYIEKQKEQKQTSFNEPYNPDEYEVVMEGNATSLKRKEQKPAEWSEEDEKKIHFLARLIELQVPRSGTSDRRQLPSGQRSR